MHYYIVSPQEITERTYDSGVSKGTREGSCPPVSPNYFWLSITKISMSMINFPEWAKSTLSQQCIKRFAIRHYFIFGSHALLRPPQKNRGRTSSPRNLVMPLIVCLSTTTHCDFSSALEVYLLIYVALGGRISITWRALFTSRDRSRFPALSRRAAT